MTDKTLKALGYALIIPFITSLLYRFVSLQSAVTVCTIATMILLFVNMDWMFMGTGRKLWKVSMGAGVVLFVPLIILGFEQNFSATHAMNIAGTVVYGVLILVNLPRIVKFAKKFVQFVTTSYFGQID